MTTLWVNGSLRGTDEPAIVGMDHGLTVGDGVFETLKVVHGQPFALTRHLQRLARSANGLGLPEPDWDAIQTGCAAVVRAHPPAPLLRLRITCTAGPGPLGSDRGSASPTIVVAASPAPAWPAAVAVALAPWPRNERGPLVGLKTTSYADNVVALAWAKARGAGEALFANTTGELCEGTGSNVFVVVDGDVLTPRLESGCLAGITRELVLEWTDAIEAQLDVSVLRSASEVFLTSSTRDVQPVGQIEGVSTAVGPHSRRIQAVFAERSTADVDP
jgi:branched-chain amino acid aminotransferase